jgi:acetyl-CoA C-acetyltransferase
MNDVVIVSAVRLPAGRFLGALRTLTAPQLGALVVREAVCRAGIPPASVEECIMGEVLSAGAGQAPARQAALNGGLHESVAALTINKVCGSGLKAVMLGAQAIGAGDVEVVVAGGMESMSNAPYLLKGVREGVRMGHQPMLDSMVADGLWCAFEDFHMGSAGEVVAREFGVTRGEQDAYALESHRRAAAAVAAGAFSEEILPVEISGRKGETTRVTHDEPVRSHATADALGALPPAFDPAGTVTSGNASPLSDGAAALVLTSAARARSLGVRPLARVVGQATSGLAPRLVLMTPVESIRKLLSRVGWTLDDVDLFEINEAFAAQMVAVLRELALSPAKVNVSGGAIALGHPIGASGARILTTLLYSMAARDARRGVAALCLGGGNGVALAVERAQ